MYAVAGKLAPEPVAAPNARPGSARAAPATTAGASELRRVLFTEWTLLLVGAGHAPGNVRIFALFGNRAARRYTGLRRDW